MSEPLTDVEGLLEKLEAWHQRAEYPLPQVEVELVAAMRALVRAWANRLGVVSRAVSDCARACRRLS